MEKPKFCEDCKWLKRNLFNKVSIYASRCLHPNASRYGSMLVSIKHGPKAHDERFNGNCGPNGKLWEVL